MIYLMVKRGDEKASPRKIGRAKPRVLTHWGTIR